LNEDNTYSLHVNALLQKHFVVASWVSSLVVRYFFS
jgi:hypothetical protein